MTFRTIARFSLAAVALVAAACGSSSSSSSTPTVPADAVAIVAGVPITRTAFNHLMDIGIQKNFHITESKSLQFRTEFLNAFNNVVFSAPNANCGNYFTPSAANPLSTPANLACGSSMGLITGSQSERNIQFALKFIF